MFDPTKSIPGLAAHRRVILGHLPTPIDPMPVLGRALGISLSVKRDDCTGLAFGGNKVRQLEYYLGPATDAGADTVLITGALQSNFTRLTAAAARKLGMAAHLQLEERVKKTDLDYRTSGNILVERMLGAHVHYFLEGEDEGAADHALDRLAAELAAAGRRPYVIHLGTGHPPLGGLGYVAAAAELHHQLAATGDPEQEAIVVPSGSGLTHAGTLVGVKALGWPVPVIGICVRREAEAQHPRVLGRAREIAALIGRDGLISPSDVVVSDEVLHPGYGQLNDQVNEAMAMAAQLEALILDPVYSGRCMAGLIQMARTGRLAPGASVLFIHTGGQPAIFGYRNMIGDEVFSPEG